MSQLDSESKLKELSLRVLRLEHMLEGLLGRKHDYSGDCHWHETIQYKERWLPSVEHKWRTYLHGEFKSL